MPRVFLAAAFVALCVDAHAGILTATDIVDNSSADATFSIVSSDPSAAFVLKTQGGETGVGVSGGRTPDEIDFDETVVAEFTTPVTIDLLNLMLLFPPPAYDDTEERAQVAAWGPSSSEPVVVTLTAGYGPIASYDGQGTVLVPTAAEVAEGGPALWALTDPFGDMLVTRLEFTALSNLGGFCPEGSCTNDSDYVIERIGYTLATAAIPEPTTVGLLGVGLVGLWSSKRRQRRSPPTGRA